MSDLVWWVIFVLLLLLLIVSTVKLLSRIVADYCCDDKDDCRDTEDLTRYKTNSKSIYKNIEYQDVSDTLTKRKEFPNGGEESKSVNVNVEDETKRETDQERQAEPEEKQEEGDTVEDAQTDTTDGPRKEDDETSGFTSEEKEILDQILGIKGEADIYAKQIPYYLGGKNHLQYYEMNQKFIMNSINLGKIDCKNNEKLKRRKAMVSMFVRECQEQLKEKADNEYLL